MEETKLPKGPENLNCMFWQKPMSEVCHTCPLWTEIKRQYKEGEDTLTEKHWVCGLAAIVPVAIEMLQETASTSIEVNKLRNTVAGVGGGLMQIASANRNSPRLTHG